MQFKTSKALRVRGTPVGVQFEINGITLDQSELSSFIGGYYKLYNNKLSVKTSKEEIVNNWRRKK